MMLINTGGAAVRMGQVSYYGLVHFDKGLWNYMNKLVKDGIIPFSLETFVFKMHLIHLPHIFLSWVAILTRNPALLHMHLPSKLQVTGVFKRSDSKCLTRLNTRPTVVHPAQITNYAISTVGNRSLLT
jgi:hypothetical protein